MQDRNRFVLGRLRGYFAQADGRQPFGLVPWWPERVAWKRDAELIVNALAMLPHRAGRVHWRISRVDYYRVYVVRFWVTILG